MGFYSEVQICAEKKAFDMFHEVLKKHSVVMELSEHGDVSCIRIAEIKWYSSFEVVKEVEDVCKKLHTEEFDKEDYGFKMVILNEDNTYSEYYNDTGDARFCDMYITCYIENPYFH